MNLLIVFLVFLGVVFGRILRSVAKEEIKPGKKYFDLFGKLVLAILVFVFLYGNLSLLCFIGVIIGFLAGFFFKEIYFYLGLGLFFSFLMSKEYSLLVASLVFIYGLFSFIMNKFSNMLF